MAGIDEGVGADTGDRSRLAGGDVPEKMTDNTLGEVVSLDLIVDGELLQLRAKPPVAADDPTDQPFVTQMIEAALLAIALTSSVHQGQIAGAAALEKLSLDLNGNGLGEADPDEPACRDGGAIADQPDCLIGCDDLVLRDDLPTAEKRMAFLL